MGWLVSTKKRTARHEMRAGVQSNLIQSTADGMPVFKLLMASRGTPSTDFTICYRALSWLLLLTGMCAERQRSRERVAQVERCFA